MKIRKNSELVLRKLRRLGEVEVTRLKDAIKEFDAKNTINSLVRLGYIDVVRILHRREGGPRSKGFVLVRVIAVSDKGLKELRKLNAIALAAKKAAQEPPKPPKEVKAPKEELHQMQSWIIPERDPNVSVTSIEIEGRTVKVTYGRGFTATPYSPPKEPTRYKPRLIRGIHAQ